MNREEFSQKTKVAAFQRAGGYCEYLYPDETRCWMKLYPGNVEYDHDIPAELGGGSSLENCRALCKFHHKVKTKSDQADIGRARRVHAKHVGAYKPKRHRWGYGKNDKFRKKVTGEVVER